jgi:hypothetical protein
MRAGSGQLFGTLELRAFAEGRMFGVLAAKFAPVSARKPQRFHPIGRAFLIDQAISAYGNELMCYAVTDEPRCRGG